MKNPYRDTAPILCYHDTMQILCYNGSIMNVFQQKSLKLQWKKQPARRKK